MRALWTASTGMKAQSLKLDVIANNLANVDTVGFKKSRADFQDLLYQSLKNPGDSTGPSSVHPTGQQVGSGTKLSTITKIFSEGALKETSRELDIAILGDGFIQITGPNGDTLYTRDGALQVDADGAIVNGDGYAVQGVGSVPVDAVSLSFGTTGTVSYIDNTGTSNSIGTLQLAKFINPSGLLSLGSNLYMESDASGSATVTNPGDNVGFIQQNFLELSNVSIAEEMVDMISSQRAYEVSSKMIKSASEMLSIANQIAS